MRDLALHRYHHYEFGSAAFQIGIVLASAEVITGIAALVFAGGFLGLAGIAMLGFGLYAPHLLPSSTKNAGRRPAPAATLARQPVSTTGLRAERHGG